MGNFYSLQHCKEAMATPWSVSISFSPPSVEEEVKNKNYLLDCGVPYSSAKHKVVPTITTNNNNDSTTINEETKTSGPTTTTSNTTVKFGWTLQSNQEFNRDRRQTNRANRRRGQAPSPTQMNDVIGSTLTHMLGRSDNNNIQPNKWKILLPKPGNYRCTVLVGDPSFATVTNMTMDGGGDGPPKKVIHELKLPVGRQKEVTFDALTNDVGELQFYNVTNDRSKKTSIKIASIRFDMLGGNYDELIGSKGIQRKFISNILTKQLYNQKELNKLFGPTNENNNDNDNIKSEEKEQEKQSKKFGGKHNARSRQGLDDYGNDAMSTHLTELSATGCSMNEYDMNNNTNTTNTNGDGSLSTGGDEDSSNFGRSRTDPKTMSVLVRTLAHSTKNSMPDIIIQLEKRLIVITRLLYDLMGNQTNGKATSSDHHSPLYKSDASFQIMSELFNRSAKSPGRNHKKRKSVPDSIQCICDLYNYYQLIDSSDKNVLFRFEKNNMKVNKNRKKSNPTRNDTFKHQRTISKLMKYIQTIQSNDQGDLLHIFQLCIIGRSAIISNENARSSLKHPLGDLYPMGCIIPTISHLYDIRAEENGSGGNSGGPCYLMVQWGIELINTAISALNNSKLPPTSILLSLLKNFIDGICLMSDELWVAKSFLKPIVSLLASCTKQSNEAESGIMPHELMERNDMNELIATLSVLVGRLTCSLVRGNPVSETERNLRGWMKSTLFHGGLIEKEDQSNNEEKEDDNNKIKDSSISYAQILNAKDTSKKRKNDSASYPPLNWDSEANSIPLISSPASIGCDQVIASLNTSASTDKDDTVSIYPVWSDICAYMKKNTHDVSVKGRIKLSFYKVDRKLKKHDLSTNEIDRMYFCALIRHGSPNLWQELHYLIDVLNKKKKEGVDVDVDDSSRNEIVVEKEIIMPTLSEDLNSCWLEVLRMRRHISVTMSSMYKSLDDKIKLSHDNDNVENNFNLPPLRSLSSKDNNKKMQRKKSSKTSMRQASSDGFRRRQMNMRRRRKPRLIKHSKTIQQYEKQLKARIQLLLDVRPSWLSRSLKFPEKEVIVDEVNDNDAVDHNVVEGGRQLSQASSRWQTTIPHDTLRTLVERWNSHDSREEREDLKQKWNDVLYQQQTGGNSYGDSKEGEDGNFVVGSRSNSLRVASTTDDTISIADGIFTQVRLYVGDGESTPPTLLRLLMKNVRGLRFRCRRYGFLGLKRALDILDNRPKCMRFCLEYLRSSMAGSLEPYAIAPLQHFLPKNLNDSQDIEAEDTNGETKSETKSETKDNSSSSLSSSSSSSSTRSISGGLTGEEQLSTDLSLVRHHYMKSLQGITLSEAESLQSSFIELYTTIFNKMNKHSDLQSRTQEEDDISSDLISTSLWCWCLDYQPLDFEFLVRIGLNEILEKSLGVTNSSSSSSSNEKEISSLSSAREKNKSAISALYRWILLCSVGGRKGFYNGCVNRRKMMKSAIKESVRAQRLDLVDPAVRFRSAIVDGERVQSLPGVMMEPEEGADECLKMSLYLQSRLLELIQHTLRQSSEILMKENTDKSVIEEQEECVYNHLTFMLSILSKAACQIHLKPIFYKSVVFRLYGNISPRITRTLMHMLSILLTSPLISTFKVLNAWKEETEDKEKKEKKKKTIFNDLKLLSDYQKVFIQCLLEKIGKSMEWKIAHAEAAMDSARITATEMAHAASRGIGLSSNSSGSSGEGGEGRDGSDGSDGGNSNSNSNSKGSTKAPPAPEAPITEEKAEVPPIPQFEIPPEYLDQLLGMGFPKEHCERALKKFNLNVEQSLNWLLTDPNELRTPEEELSLEKHQSVSLEMEKDTAEELKITSETIATKLKESSESFKKLRESGKRKSDCDVGHGSGISNSATVDDEIMLIRRLLNNTIWSTIVKEVIINTLIDSTPPKKDTTPLTSSSHRLLIACFSILGGHVESIRVGGRIKVLSSTGTNTGVVIKCDYGEQKMVLFDGAMDFDYVPGSDECFCIDTIPPPIDIVPLDYDLCTVYDKIMFQICQNNPYIPMSTSAKALDREEKELLRSASTSSDTSVDSKTKEDTSSPLTDSDVSLSLLRTYCIRSFVSMVKNGTSAKEAVKCGLLPQLLQLSSSPVVTLADTVSLSYLEKRHIKLRCIMHDIRTGGIVPLDARPPLKKKVIELTDKEKKRHSMADQLMAMCIHSSREKDLYLFGLEENGDDLNRALDWFMSGAADAALQGDVLSAMKGTKNEEMYPESHKERWEKANQIAQMVGMPAKLCFQFLEVAERGAVDMAAELVMTYGMKHVAGLEKKETGETKVSDLISDSQCKGVDDTAPLSDMGYSDKDIKMSSSSFSSSNEAKESDQDEDSYSRRALFRDLCKTLVGVESEPNFLRVSSLPMETVVLSDEKVVSYDALLPGQRIFVAEGGLLKLRGVIRKQNSESGGVVYASTVNIHTGRSYDCELFPEHQEIWAISLLCGRSITSLQDVRCACLSTERALTSMYARMALVSLSKSSSEAGTSGISLEDMPINVSSPGNSSNDKNYLTNMREVALMLYDAKKHSTRVKSATRFLELLKLCAASENIFVRGALQHSHLVQTPVTNFLRTKLKDLITRQESNNDHSMSKVLIDECIANLNDSTTPGPGTDASTRDSLHPIFPRCSYVDTVFMDGAKMLWVLFDPRCETKKNATLSFYHGNDTRCQTPIAQFHGTNFMPFVVPGNRVHFKFTSSNSTSTYEEGNGCGWGYRFQVRPLRGLSWTRESQIKSPSLEWACWLLEFLLNEVSELGVGTVHNKKVFNAMVAYLRAKGTPYKHRIIALLTQMLRSPTKFPKNQVPNTKALRGIESAVFDWCKKYQASRSSSSSGLPRRVMQLIEMSITARVSLNDFNDIAKGRKPRVYGAVDPSSNDQLIPVPEPVLNADGLGFTRSVKGLVESIENGNSSSMDEGAILIDVVKTTEALYGNTRLPDDLMNFSIMEARGFAKAIENGDDGDNETKTTSSNKEKFIGASKAIENGDDGDNETKTTSSSKEKFIGASRFGGAKEGYVFKTGHRGLGYYLN